LHLLLAAVVLVVCWTNKQQIMLLRHCIKQIAAFGLSSFFCLIDVVIIIVVVVAFVSVVVVIVVLLSAVSVDKQTHGWKCTPDLLSFIS
jgi:hypothetical protein